VLIQYPRRLRKSKSGAAGALTMEFMAGLLKAVGEGRLQREGILPAMRHWLAGGENLWESWQGMASKNEMLGWIAEARVAECRSLDPAARHRLLMGRVMAKAAGRINGAELAESIKGQEGVL